MVDNTEVTTVITAYNAERYIARAIGSVLKQSYGPIKVIVVDDGSTDHTSDVVKSYGNLVQLIQFEKNYGPAVGRTTGLMKTTTEYVSFLDADDYWEEEFAVTTVNFLKLNSAAVAVNTGYQGINWSGRRCFRPVLETKDSLYYQPEGALCDSFFDFWAKYRSVLTGTVMMRTDVAIKTLGQRSDLRLTQDLEFWGYLATFGKWGFIPKALFVTDQTALKPAERLKKFKRRFAFFSNLTIHSWKKRIDPNLSKEERSHFNNFLKHIFTTIVFANAYSMKFSKSYRLAKSNSDMLEKEGWGKGLRVALAMGRIGWPLGCLLLRFREVAKAYITHKS